VINLLPPDLKDGYRYASHNHRLVRWVIMFGIGLVGVGAIAAAGIIYMQQTTESYTDNITAANASLKKQHLVETETEVKEISNNLKLVVQVLSREVLFSKLLKQLANVTPANTVLTNLTIAQTSGGISITAKAIDYQSATQLQVNLADPANKIFSKADIIAINCSSTDKTSIYPCTVTLRALFAEDNPFVFFNSDGTAAS
jgi:Tfp pilus assembly protein PilN